ncbi:MAG TPA: FlgD immunoglobulin-like domain containing protein [Candidatus Fermentibacter daniensis]|nr:FlgD immunoglobulin-like domain containing protein [Candidatus Fermentibacter daniensis]HOR08232.1 FlgD immunoglobulin-like domain containing protein [Candidatus Fermentibacter daniensis]HPK52780.1 FlgD immunoglobulin-like domain containing protein [Candidatus Fermentibacter daniensis]
MSGSVYALAVSGSDVYVGGQFTQAGGSPASRIARWRDPDVGIDATPEVITGILHASPNPTASGVELSFRSIGLSPLTLEIYDASGRLVRTQDLGTLPAGSQAHYWNGQGGNGQALAQGVYFVRLSSAELEASTRVVLLR